MTDASPVFSIFTVKSRRVYRLIPIQPPSKESPLSLNYIKAWRIFSSTMFAWPKEKDKGKRSTLIVVCRTLLPVVLGVFLIGNVTYIYRYQHEADFTTRGHLYITLISGIVTIVSGPSVR
ncbi:hypothetical protein EVAR_34104_1 [Eumeta japonica]|uniref:Uncharacterized protein n=1 Tax=Eumeta variegata TaxID=151549 RepID=A0A4C1WIT0_EUMVA|nr:hypothetical protein EVAR_34104_1 [Eumeta japonica]